MHPPRIATQAPCRPSQAKALVGAALGVGLFASCQSYEPRPLDRPAHREAWHARALDATALEAFLDGLESRPPAEGPLDLDDGLSLQEAQLVALAFNPGLRLARLRVGRAQVSAEHAGRWSDPELSFSVLHVTESVPDPWIVTPGLALALPLTGRLDAERGLAEAQRGALQGALLESEWSLWKDVRGTWIQWSAAWARHAESEKLAAAVDELADAAARLAERGELLRTEANLFRIEQAERRLALARLEGETGVLEEQLRSLLGLPPEAQVDLQPLLPDRASGAFEATAATGAQELERRNLTLERLRAEYQVAEETLRHAIAKQSPDLRLGPLFESEAGQSRVGVLGALPLPFFNGNARAINEARVDREIARATLESTYETLVGRWSTAQARATSLTRQRTEAEQVLLPLVEAQLRDAHEQLRLGEGAALVVLESLQRALQAKFTLIDARAAEALARTEAAFWIGPEVTEAAAQGTNR